MYIHKILLNYNLCLKRLSLHLYRKCQKTPFFFHMAYFCRARNDSHEITRDMLKCNRGKSLTRTPLRIGVDIVKNIVEKHGCFVLVVN